MKLYILTNKFKYSEYSSYPDTIGIFDSLEAVEKAKQAYMDMMPELPHDIFRFYVAEFEINKVT